MKLKCDNCGESKPDRDFDVIYDGFKRCRNCSADVADNFWSAEPGGTESSNEASLEVARLNNKISQLNMLLEDASQERDEERRARLSLEKEAWFTKVELKGWRRRATEAEALANDLKKQVSLLKLSLKNAELQKPKEYESSVEINKADLLLMLSAAIRGGETELRPLKPIKAKGNGTQKQSREERAQELIAGRKSGYVYLIRSVHGLYKIGRTKDTQRRLSEIKPPFPIKLHYSFPCDNMYKAEKHLHRLFVEKRMDGEWFNLGLEDVAWLMSIEHDSQLYDD